MDDRRLDPYGCDSRSLCDSRSARADAKGWGLWPPACLESRNLRGTWLACLVVPDPESKAARPEGVRVSNPTERVILGVLRLARTAVGLELLEEVERLKESDLDPGYTGQGGFVGKWKHVTLTVRAALLATVQAAAGGVSDPGSVDAFRFFLENLRTGFSGTTWAVAWRLGSAAAALGGCPISCRCLIHLGLRPPLLCGSLR